METYEDMGACATAFLGRSRFGSKSETMEQSLWRRFKEAGLLNPELASRPYSKLPKSVRQVVDDAVQEIDERAQPYTWGSRDD